MIRLVIAAICLFGPAVASASDLDAIASGLQSHGFSCRATRTFRNCDLGGLLSNGKAHEVHVFLVDVNKKATELNIFIQPAEAANSSEVGGIYENVAELFFYDKGKLRDRFPDLKSVNAWCEANGIHNPGRCTAVEPIAGDGQADFSVSSGLGNVDQWSLGWTAPTSGSVK